MELAKPALDVGLYTNQLDAMLAFWQEQANVPYVELLKLGGGAHQHRHAIGESVLKVNNTRIAIEPGKPTGLQKLAIHTNTVDEPVELLDPDGTEIVLMPVSNDRNLTLTLACNDLQRSQDFYGATLNLANPSANTFMVGNSAIELASGTISPFVREGIGLRYMTVQVFDVVSTHAAILAKGGKEGMAPKKLGDVAYISFIQDPDGNWIEISQRKSITGSLD